MAILQGKIEDRSLYSAQLNEEIELFVYLPPKYSTLIKYPVLIAQDGRDYFQLGKLAKTADRLMTDESIREFILIGVLHKGIDDRNRKYRPEGDKHDAYLKFLAHELVPWISKEFNTLMLGGSTALIGDSLGGYISLKAATLYPHTFGKLILQSPYVPEVLMEEIKSSDKMQTIQIYQSIGTEESAFKVPSGEVKNFLDPNRKLHQILTDKNLHYEYKEFQGGHLWAHWQHDIEPALIFMFQD
ncbi:alpha/beta hydrolase [Fictibacillus iocasae]|uniref:Alpha/beta hydrolase n=1 Tax=Fictibacillus iocasae TaxID=2715437 RepID=A0ABW2NR86_9BACL